MGSQFGYLSDRILAAKLATEPFPHIYLEDFLSDEDFKAVTTSPDVALPAAKNADQLFGSLESAGYEAIEFPGCTRSKIEYLKWLEGSAKPRNTHAACEAQGMALRLKRPADGFVRALSDYFSSDEMHANLRQKFTITATTRLEAGLQKYLHGYEISPHPDIRLKALTWMINVNPAPKSESLGFHTHYMTFKPQWSFIPALWQHNPKIETCWVPWDWCSTVKQQTKNNTIVIFSPRWDTVHAIRAHYDHLASQRTQLYGNLWYETANAPYAPSFRDFDFTVRRDMSLTSRATRRINHIQTVIRQTAGKT